MVLIAEDYIALIWMVDLVMVWFGRFLSHCFGLTWPEWLTTWWVGLDEGSGWFAWIGYDWMVVDSLMVLILWIVCIGQDGWLTDDLDAGVLDSTVAKTSSDRGSRHPGWFWMYRKSNLDLREQTRESCLPTAWRLCKNNYSVLYQAV